MMEVAVLVSDTDWEPHVVTKQLSWTAFLNRIAEKQAFLSVILDQVNRQSFAAMIASCRD